MVLKLRAFLVFHSLHLSLLLLKKIIKFRTKEANTGNIDRVQFLVLCPVSIEVLVTVEGTLTPTMAGLREEDFGELPLDDIKRSCGFGLDIGKNRFYKYTI